MHCELGIAVFIHKTGLESNLSSCICSQLDHFPGGDTILGKYNNWSDFQHRFDQIGNAVDSFCHLPQYIPFLQAFQKRELSAKRDYDSADQCPLILCCKQYGDMGNATPSGQPDRPDILIAVYFCVGLLAPFAGLSG